MNRAIKFRAFDKAHGIIINNYQDFFYNPVVGTKWNNEIMIIMQYTGLKDKNGVEIYEGDEINTPTGIGIVKFENGCYWIVWYPSGKTTLHDCQIKHLEVIGNIHENPELLKDKK